MNYEWNREKNESNHKKHGIRFEEAVGIFDRPYLTFIDDSCDYGEIREISIGSLEGVAIVVVIHTERNGKFRIISARKATPRERIKYHEYLQKTVERNPRNSR